MTEHVQTPDEFAAIALDDEFLDALAAGAAPTTADGPVDTLLLAWREELSVAVPSRPLALPTQREGSDDIPSDRRRTRRRRGAAGAAALVVVFAASTGVAAAVPGNPLHRALFGDSRQDATLGQLEQMLAAVDDAIEDARAAGGITDVDRASLGNRLDAAQQLMLQHDLTTTSLSDQIADLRAALAALPPLVVATPDDLVGPGDRPAGDSDGGNAAADDNDDSAADESDSDGDVESTGERSGTSSGTDGDRTGRDSDDGSDVGSSDDGSSDTSDSSDSEDATTTEGGSSGEGSDYGMSDGSDGSAWGSEETAGEAAVVEAEG